MQNLKIQVNSEAESKEAQELFLKYGATGKICLDQSIRYVCTFNGILTQYDFLPCVEFKQINLPELRAMVNPMKEYLDKQEDGTYKLITASSGCVDRDWIEIPEGAEVATICRNYIIFWKDEKYSFSVSEENKWCYKSCDDSRYFSLGEYMNEYGDVSIIWQREQDEPFLTPECTLNDQYAEIGQVRQAINKSWGSVGAASGGVDATLAERQSQYGCYEDVAHVTQQILSALRIGNYDELPAPMKESLHMIASKMARIVNGDPEYLDNWHDIGGYAKLIEKLIKGE